MEAAEIRDLSIEKIETEIEDTREELMRLRFQKATGELTDHNLLRSTRRKIGRLLTIRNQKIRQENMEGEA